MATPRQLLLGETQAIVEGELQGFDWSDYGMDEVEDVTGEEWVQHLGKAIAAELHRRGMLKPETPTILDSSKP